MRISKILMVLTAALVVTGCTCKTKQIAQEAPQVPVATEKSPLDDIHFAFDKYNVDSLSQGILKKNVEWLKQNPSAKVQVEGHCDERGTAEYNMALGQRRAKAAYEYMKTLGVDASRMSTVSYGKELPLDPAHNEAAWAKNRRAHFVVQK